MRWPTATPGAVGELRHRRSFSDCPVCRSLEERQCPSAETCGHRENGCGRPLSGTPLIKETRVPLQRVAPLFDARTPVSRILNTYPSLTESQVRLSSSDEKVGPQRR